MNALTWTQSRISWLDHIPSHWEENRLAVYLQRRIVKNNDDVSRDRLSLSAYRGVVLKNYGEDDYVMTDDDLSNYAVVEAGQLVVNPMWLINGGIGVSQLSGVVSPAYRMYDISPKLHGRFLDYLLRSQMYVQDYNRYTRGVTTYDRSVKEDDFREIVIPVPPIEEQQIIAAYLDRETGRIDALVERLERLIALLTEKRQAVISHAVTKGLNPDAPMKDSGIDWLGEVPAHWDSTKLGRIAFMQEGPGLRHWQFTDDGVRVICVTNITDHGIDFERLEKFISEEEYEQRYRHFTVCNGDILLSSSGNSWGKVAVHTGGSKVILNTSTIRLNSGDHDDLVREYLVFLLKSDAVREQLDLAMTGACQPNFGPTHLNSVMVPIPTTEEQTKIARYLERQTGGVEAQIEKARRTITVLQERRSALISAAVTGQIPIAEMTPDIQPEDAA